MGTSNSHLRETIEKTTKSIQERVKEDGGFTSNNAYYIKGCLEGLEISERSHEIIRPYSKEVEKFGKSIRLLKNKLYNMMFPSSDKIYKKNIKNLEGSTNYLLYRANRID